MRRETSLRRRETWLSARGKSARTRRDGGRAEEKRARVAACSGGVVELVVHVRERLVRGETFVVRGERKVVRGEMKPQDAGEESVAGGEMTFQRSRTSLRARTGRALRVGRTIGRQEERRERAAGCAKRVEALSCGRRRERGARGKGRWRRLEMRETRRGRGGGLPLRFVVAVAPCPTGGSGAGQRPAPNLSRLGDACLEPLANEAQRQRLVRAEVKGTHTKIADQSDEVTTSSGDASRHPHAWWGRRAHGDGDEKRSRPNPPRPCRPARTPRRRDSTKRWNATKWARSARGMIVMTVTATAHSREAFSSRGESRSPRPPWPRP